MDLGEGGSHDKVLLNYATSCNIACGGHAGDATSIMQTLHWAQAAAVAVGAHPSYPDRLHFGRKSLPMATGELEASLLEQLGMFAKALKELNLSWHHIKPHGALYNDLSENVELGNRFISVLGQLQFDGIIYALAGSSWARQLLEAGYDVWEEAFVDRTYGDSGHLVSRKESHAVLTTAKAVQEQTQQLLSGYVITHSGKFLAVSSQTLCLHSDTPNATVFAPLVAQIINV